MLFNLILLPLLSLIIILFIPRRYLNLIKILTITFSSFIFLYSLLLFFFFDIYQKYNYKFLICILKPQKVLNFKDLYIDLQFNDFLNSIICETTIGLMVKMRVKLSILDKLATPDGCS